MTAARLQLTPEIQDAIRRYILSGAYPLVAAEAAGVPRETFVRWMRRRRAFREAIVQAAAQARLAAEAKTMTKDPLAWLKCGPGKDDPDIPGWSNPPRGDRTSAAEGRLLERDDVQRMIAVLLRILEPFPEARLAAAEALQPLVDAKPQAAKRSP